VAPQGPDHPELAKLGVKIPLPDPYDGASNLEAFESWLGQLINWFQMYNLDIDSTQMDRIRLQVLGQQLKGKASLYFQQRTEEASSACLSWSFKIAIRKLRDRFLYKATVLKAAFKFENLMQGS
jgi:hypothetical protein